MTRIGRETSPWSGEESGSVSELERRKGHESGIEIVMRGNGAGMAIVEESETGTMTLTGGFP